MTKPVYILNGPNLNLLGQRQPDIYGTTTLEDIKSLCENHAATLGMTIAFHQSNHEGVLVDWVQEARVKGCGIILNAAAYTHTSVALLDALLASDLPIIEVHLSNIHQRDTFRHHSFVSKAAKGMICGFGAQGYVLALDALKPLIAPSS
ncbi:3-dehydroquinate dehydratase [Thalassospira profundimaris]|uniref:3-dehydroquinate dehydratase n=1 Tax=Thalassospira profundimaris TaxID=502049 RepID=A0A367XLZ6_9PROT|nr:type II 3-dehydroquinate dehydratase [Thalassospira profundimaris]RCK53752.1 3-dehydroquinate dehydratase [Thalassospira profundimaris]